MRRMDLVWSIESLDPLSLSQLAHALVEVRPYQAKQLALHLLAHSLDDDTAQLTAGSLVNSAIADIAMTVKAEVVSKPKKRKVVPDKETIEKPEVKVTEPDGFKVNPFLAGKWGEKS